MIFTASKFQKNSYICIYESIELERNLDFLNLPFQSLNHNLPHYSIFIDCFFLLSNNYLFRLTFSFAFCQIFQYYDTSHLRLSANPALTSSIRENCLVGEIRLHLFYYHLLYLIATYAQFSNLRPKTLLHISQVNNPI